MKKANRITSALIAASLVGGCSTIEGKPTVPRDEAHHWTDASYAYQRSVKTVQSQARLGDGIHLCDIDARHTLAKKDGKLIVAKTDKAFFTVGSKTLRACAEGSMIVSNNINIRYNDTLETERSGWSLAVQQLRALQAKRVQDKTVKVSGGHFLHTFGQGRIDNDTFTVIYAYDGSDREENGPAFCELFEDKQVTMVREIGTVVLGAQEHAVGVITTDYHNWDGACKTGDIVIGNPVESK